MQATLAVNQAVRLFLNAPIFVEFGTLAIGQAEGGLVLLAQPERTAVNGHGNDVFRAVDVLYVFQLLRCERTVGAALSGEVLYEHILLGRDVHGAVEAFVLVDILTGCERGHRQAQGCYERIYSHGIQIKACG